MTQRRQQQAQRQLQQQHGTIDATREAIREENQQRMADGEKPVPWVPIGAAQHSQGRYGISALAMGKHGYAMWLNVKVYGKFHKGQMVTTIDQPFVVGTVPKGGWFTIMDIQEIHYMADMDTEKREPKALFVESGKYKISCWMCPSRLRVLQPEETKAVYDLLLNKAKSIDPEDAPDVGADESIVGNPGGV